jgi:phage terminase large subunit GpA-like protein
MRFDVKGGGLERIQDPTHDSGRRNRCNSPATSLGKGQTTVLLKGMQQPGQPTVSNPTQNNSCRIKLFAVGVYAVEDAVVSRMKLTRPEGGYMRLSDSVGEEYLAAHVGEGRSQVRAKP